MEYEHLWSIVASEEDCKFWRELGMNVRGSPKVKKMQTIAYQPEQEQAIRQCYAVWQAVPYPCNTAQSVAVHQWPCCMQPEKAARSAVLHTLQYYSITGI